MYEKKKKSGQSFSDWLKSKPIEELKRIELSNGGSVSEKIRRSYRTIQKENRCNAWRKFNRPYINRIRKAELQEKIRNKVSD